MSTSRIQSRGSRRKPRQLLDKPSGATCSEVTITRADGTVEIGPALTAAQLRRAAPDRLVITPAMRARVLGRDQATCRYCLTTVGPFEIDHVIPVTHGGATKLWNLVTACVECNRRKGAQTWRPKPLEAVQALGKRFDPGSPRRRRPRKTGTVSSPRRTAR